MAWPQPLRQRRCEDEIMDQPDLDPHLHRHALRGLARINAWSGSARILWPPVVALARRGQPATLRVLDVATGAGDIPIRLWQRARLASLNIEIAGCDRSAVAVAHASRNADDASAPVQFFVRNVLTETLPEDFDVITCSLFLHHLAEIDALALLRAMKRAARRLVLVNDLRRSATGWLLAYTGARVLTRSPVVHVDGPRSVAAAFTCAEAAELALRAGLGGATVSRRWPFRFLLTWQRP